MKWLIYWLKRWHHFWSVPRNHPAYERTQTPHYQMRLEKVKDFWIIGGLAMLLSGHPAFILTLSLFLVFLSFAYLEEE